PQKATLKRGNRLLKAKHWLTLTDLEGKALVHSYAKKFRTGLTDSIIDLRLLGVTITAEYEECVKRSVMELTKQKHKKREEKLNAHLDDSEQGHHFAYIAGYTGGGAPYGLAWDQPDEEERSMYPYQM
ncbi:MAG: hypothetical protein ABIN91_04810, partial [Mucilaginibacter sp.]